MKTTPLKYEKFKKYLKTYNDRWAGFPNSYRWYFEFPNGYGVSVVKFYGTYGYEQDLFEIGTMYKGHLTNIKGITEDDQVLGYLTNDKVLYYLERILKL